MPSTWRERRYCADTAWKAQLVRAHPCRRQAVAVSPRLAPGGHGICGKQAAGALQRAAAPACGPGMEGCASTLLPRGWPLHTCGVDGAPQDGPLGQLGADEPRHTGAGVNADADAHRVGAVGHEHLHAGQEEGIITCVHGALAPTRGWRTVAQRRIQQPRHVRTWARGQTASGESHRHGSCLLAR